MTQDPYGHFAYFEGITVGGGTSLGLATLSHSVRLGPLWLFGPITPPLEV